MLQPEQVELLRGLLQSSGWRDVMEPAIKQRGNILIKNLMKAPTERPEPFRSTPDDVIRGEIRGIEWLLGVWINEVSVHDHNRALDERDRNGAAGANDAQPATQGVNS